MIAKRRVKPPVAIVKATAKVSYISNTSILQAKKKITATTTEQSWLVADEL